MQEQGIVGRLVGGMIRRSVRHRFHTVYWQPPKASLTGPVILYANHHGWMDGYLMFHVVTALELESVDWIQEFDSFPLFSRIGGLRFAAGDVSGRAATIRRTIRLMNDDRKSLVIFPEGTLHRPPELLPFGRAMESVARRVPGVRLVPVAIRTELSMHERPEAWIALGEHHAFDSLEDCRGRLESQMELVTSSEKICDFVPLVRGRLDVNERMNIGSVSDRRG